MDRVVADFNDLEISPEKLVRLEGCLETIVSQIETNPENLEIVTQISSKIEETLKYLEISNSCQGGNPTKIPSLIFRLLSAAGPVSIRDIFELVNLEISSSIFILTSTMTVKDCPKEIHVSASRLLSSLAGPAAAFAAVPPEADESIETLTTRYSRYVNGLIQAIIECKVVDAYGRCVVFHQLDHLTTDFLLKDFMSLILNCFKLCSQYQKQLRVHLAAQTSIVRDILLPYLDNLLPVFTQPSEVTPDRVEWATLLGVLRALTAVSFNIKIFRKMLHGSQRWFTVLEISCQKPEALVALLKLAINCDFSEAPFWTEFINKLHAMVNEKIPGDLISKIFTKLTTSSKDGLPLVASSSAKSAILSLFSGNSPMQAKSTSPPLDPFTAFSETDDLKETEIKDTAMEEKKTETTETTETGMKQIATNVAVMKETESKETETKETEKAVAKASEFCALSGVLMTDPVRSPGNLFFERHSIVDWLEKNNFCPITGDPLKIEDLRDAPEMLEKIVKIQLSNFQTPSPPSPPSFPSPPRAPVLLATAATPLLGDLPPLAKPRKIPSAGAARLKIDRASEAMRGVPKEMRCAIDGRVMTDPVQSPYGHRFERLTITRWVDSLGSVCPITNQPLSLSECKPDLEMRSRILEWLRVNELVK